MTAETGPRLSGKQRKYLRGCSHELHVVVQVGRQGLTDAVRAQVRDAFEAHELIKVRVEADREDRARLAEELARIAGAALAGTVGKVAILYRAHHDPTRRRLVLPD